jgi:hypothetical protein
MQLGNALFYPLLALALSGGMEGEDQGGKKEGEE